MTNETIISKARGRLASPADHTDEDLIDAAKFVLTNSGDPDERAEAWKWLTAMQKEETA